MSRQIALGYHGHRAETGMLQESHSPPTSAPSWERRPSRLGAHEKNPYLLPEELGQLLTCFRI